MVHDINQAVQHVKCFFFQILTLMLTSKHVHTIIVRIKFTVKMLKGIYRK